MNIHETYVSLEVAKLLKQAGFDWECIRYYQNNNDTLLGPLVDQYKLVCTNFNVAPIYMNQYSAPTLEVAQRWLREVKKCIIYIFPQSMSEYHCVLMRGHEDGVNYSIDWQEFDFPTYESALEAGIKNCLTVILEKNK